MNPVTIFVVSLLGVTLFLAVGVVILSRKSN